jgi:predicted Rossmann fold nucleotide-binding protein DprA/Smf involved in DNA uptake
MSVITDAVGAWKGRLSELEQQLAPLVDEAEQLRTAIARLEAIEPATGASRSANRGAGGARRGAARTPTARAPRGQNRRLILEAIRDAPKTAGDVAKQTGIGRPTVSTTLTKLVSDGAAVKANRGYKAA